MVAATASAVGILSLLDEPENELKVYSLTQLDAIVDQFWAEIADYISKIEALYEDPKFPSHELAALVASKVYYHLGEYDESVSFALNAGKLFDVESSDRSQFVDTIIHKCIDKYIQLIEQGKAADVKLTAVVERMFQRCLNDKEFKQAIGIGLESRRLDFVEQAIVAGQCSEDLLKYTLEASTTVVEHLDFRNKILQILVKLFKSLKQPDYITIGACLVWLNDPNSMADMLLNLVSGDQTHKLIAYQIAFDSYSNATQEFLLKVLAALPKATPSEAASAMEVDGKPAEATTSGGNTTEKLRDILSGNISIKLNLEFLYRNNKADQLILKNTKNALDARSSVYHSAVTFAHAFMNAGTTSDVFLRNNMEWLARANNWTKFTATAQLGVIHKGNLANSMTLLQPYLPQDGVSSSAYSEGGSLFALGLIHANHGAPVLSYLKQQLTNSQNEVIQHGASLGLGAAGMATDDADVYNALKTALFADNAVVGEAAGIAMGLVMLGTGSDKAVEEMIQYAHDTQHDKIIRGLALGVALISYGREEKADGLIDRLLADKDAIIRYGGVFAIALAYVGTSNNGSIKKLLHLAVSDVNDDVRRAAVMALGLVLLRTPKQVPRVVQLLSESYNPHVRYGSAMALGISCAGTGMAEALNLLEPLTKDTTDFVRQGAFIAAAMILIQHNEKSCPKVATYRALYEKVITAKHEDPMARFGAVLSQGIIDAGGRNVTISLLSGGQVNMESVVGMVLFTQFWYWYPLAHFLSLAFTPTALIGLNGNLDIPKFSFLSNAKPSMFAYPPMTAPPTEEKVEKVATAVLSTTAKAKARAKKLEKEKTGDSMEMDEKETSESTAAAKSPEEPTEKKPEEEKDNSKKEEEPLTEELSNLSRVVPAQIPCIKLKSDSRYGPIKKGALGGILLLVDRQPGQPEELIEFSTPKVAAGASEEEKEPDPPEPFTYTE